MRERKQQILKAIINHFIQTAQPVGSNTIVVSYQFKVSPATIRNDMAALEEEGYIYQPHKSSGRVPTDEGYRLYIDEMADIKKARKQAITFLEHAKTELKQEEAKEKVYKAVSLLSKASPNVTFATIPNSSRTFYLGISNVLKQPEFSEDSQTASQVIEVLEKNDNFIKTLKALDIDETTKVFVGKENLLEQIKSCSLIVSQYNVDGFKGYIGIMGPTRMNYPYCQALIEEIKKEF